MAVTKIKLSDFADFEAHLKYRWPQQTDIWPKLYPTFSPGVLSVVTRSGCLPTESHTRNVSRTNCMYVTLKKKSQVCHCYANISATT
jgi:hypothetical protein